MTEQTWQEFLDKLDFVQLSERWGALPLHWLEDPPPESLTSAELRLYRALEACSSAETVEQQEEQLRAAVREFRQARREQSIALPASLTPPGSRVTLRYLDPEDLGQGDCLVSVGTWDRLGYYLASRAGWADQPEEASDQPVRREPGALDYRHLVIFPAKGSPTPRAFRALCERTLRLARGLGARRLTVTHLHLPQPGLPDRFAAAELVSAIRQMIREGGGVSVEIAVLTPAQFQDYQHWFTSLVALSSGQAEGAAPPAPATAEPPAESPGPDLGQDLGQALLGLAQRTSHLAQEASRGVSSWWRETVSATRPSASPALSAPAPTNSPLEPTFEDRQALNLLYLGRWREAEAFRHRWEQDTLLGLYLAALYRVVAWLEGGSTPSGQETESTGRAEPPVSQWREDLLQTAQNLGPENPLARYFLLLAWRLDRAREDRDADLFEEHHARLLRAAWAWDDTALLAFLRQAWQDQESGSLKPAQPGYVPVFPSGSRLFPRLEEI